MLVKPSHYDDNGYVIQWMRSPIPSNSLASLYGLAKDCAERHVLGDDVDIEIHAFDETNTRIRPERLAAMIEDAGSGMVMLAGVQSNQFPRALDLARPLRARGIQVGIGGFHVSGVLSMLNGVDADLDRAKAMGVSLFAGEAEGPAGRGAARRAPPARSSRSTISWTTLPGIEGTPIPLMRGRARAAHRRRHHQLRRRPRLPLSVLVLHHHQRAGAQVAPALAGRCREASCGSTTRRGCAPFSSPTTISPATRTGSRSSTGSIYLREVEKFNTSFIIQVDTLCHKLPNFIEKCARAGVKRVFIGLENINPDNLAGAKKRQNKITEYRQMLLAWKNAGVITYAGYILGFPNDTVESIMHDIDVIKRELPVDLLEFFYLTPLPGSEDHLKLHHRRRAARSGPEQIRSQPHLHDASEDVARGMGSRLQNGVAALLHHRPRRDDSAARGADQGECQQRAVPDHLVHGLQSISSTSIRSKAACCALKYRRDRRPGLPIEPVWSFYPKYLAEIAASWCAGPRFISGCVGSICASSTIRSATAIPTWR